MLHWPKHPAGAHVRTCQECGATQVNKDPSLMKGEEWRNVKCRRCKAEGSMDFGSENTENECDHEWDEQPGEPPQDVCVRCGMRRE